MALRRAADGAPADRAPEAPFGLTTCARTPSKPEHPPSTQRFAAAKRQGLRVVLAAAALVLVTSSNELHVLGYGRDHTAALGWMDPRWRARVLPTVATLAGPW